MCHNIFIHSYVDGHLDCFQVLAIVNSAIMNIGIHVSFSLLISSGYMLRHGLLGHMVVIFVSSVTGGTLAAPFLYLVAWQIMRTKCYLPISKYSKNKKKLIFTLQRFISLLYFTNLFDQTFSKYYKN